jgi:ribosomal protein S18 acetylase RimI-like enzyme
MISMEEVKDLYRLGLKDIKKASEVLGRAFFNDPDTMKILPDDDARKDKLKHFFRCFIKFGLLYGEVYAPSPNLEGISIWVHSSTKDITFRRSLRSGFMGLIFKVNGKALNVFGSYGKQMDEATKTVIDEEHWFLFIIGVDPKHQRSGYGKKMIEPMLKRIDDEKLPVMLDTNKQVNIGYYEKFGFDVVKTYRVLENDHWGMVRKR